MLLRVSVDFEPFVTWFIFPQLLWNRFRNVTQMLLAKGRMGFTNILFSINHYFFSSILWRNTETSAPFQLLVGGQIQRSGKTGHTVMERFQRCSIKSVKFKDVLGFASFLTGCWAPRVSLPLSLCFNFLIRCVLYILSVIFLCTCME